MNDPQVKPKVLVVLAVILAGAFWLFRDIILPPEAQPESVQAIPSPVEEPLAQETKHSGPIHRIDSPEPEQTLEPSSAPLPPLDESDGEMVAALTETFGQGVEALLANSALVNKIVATVDALDSTHLSETIRAVGRLPDAFKVEATADDETFYLDPENFRRYDSAVSLAASADPKAIAAMYRRFYPLFQESYERLGYPDGYFNDRVVEVIDHLLSTPEPKGEILLQRPHVMYKLSLIHI